MKKDGEKADVTMVSASPQPSTSSMVTQSPQPSTSSGVTKSSLPSTSTKAAEGQTHALQDTLSESEVEPSSDYEVEDAGAIATSHLDSDYDTPSSGESESDSSEASKDAESERKFVVFQSSLRKLLGCCMTCGKTIIDIILVMCVLDQW